MNHRTQVAIELNKLRVTNRMLFDPSENEMVLAQFYKLAIYYLSEFKIPEAQREYINSNLDVKIAALKSRRWFSMKESKFATNYDITKQLIEQWQSRTGAFNIDPPLRAIEALFIWGQFHVRAHQYQFLHQLTSSLQKSISNTQSFNLAHLDLQ